jgi:hypothetical protein
MSKRNSLNSYLKLTKMSLFYKNRKQKVKTGPIWELVTVGEGRM